MSDSLKDAFDIMDKLFECAKTTPLDSRYLIVPPFLFAPRKKPKWYKFYSKKKKLHWLKFKRRLSLAFEGVMPNTIKLLQNSFIKE